jgi:hypothetical protein
MSRLPSENTPLGESDWVLIVPEGYPQVNKPRLRVNVY